MTIELSVDQPIAALASPPGGAARGIVRISGTQVQDIMSDWFEQEPGDDWRSARVAWSHQGRLVLMSGGHRLEISVQLLCWPNRMSYTGQPLIELHLPGSPPLLERVLSEVYRRGARPARPGEFTLRAFLAGKLDLLQAEAVLGVIDAHDHAELKTALAQLAGGVSGRLNELRRDLLELLADLEAGLDFIEEDIEFVSRNDVIHRLTAARTFVDDLLLQTAERMQSRIRPLVVLAGLPNAGKSTLFNHIVGLNQALVSAEKGTTRDFLVNSVAWRGLAFDLVDTAGWENNTLGISAAAQQQRTEQLRRADLLIWCSASDRDPDETSLDDELFHQSRRDIPASIRLLTKSDLADSVIVPSGLIPVSSKADAGFDSLASQLQTHLVSNRGIGGQWLGMTAARCRETLEAVARALRRAELAAQTIVLGDELIAVDLRDALEKLGVIMGVIYTDDILDRVFSKFCIGK
jgi:tRNA modification GTPase